MKKLLFIAIIVSNLNIIAQDVHFGVKAGTNISNYHGDDTNGSDGIVGINVGPYLSLKFGKFALQAEVLLSLQGAKVHQYTFLKDTALEGNITIPKGTTLETTGTKKSSYINIPVMVKYYLMGNFNIEIGPQIGFLVSNKDEITIKKYATSIVDESKEGLNNIDFSLNAGLGYEILNRVNLGLRSSYGLTNLEDDIDLNLKNVNIQIYVGYNFL